ncbi:hypothetical protein F511_20755 [Dorcoceras hygrometricum]|uniref:Uncharacterized protein n=1 Tax=Dorcoceras hygrometricum TaxID=472368 RepID=A0A2Z7DA22_9LAMI|nr:hypothetical protein F511_20755 [Dorcoceras hygrometricum]
MNCATAGQNDGMQLLIMNSATAVYETDATADDLQMQQLKYSLSPSVKLLLPLPLPDISLLTAHYLHSMKTSEPKAQQVKSGITKSCNRRGRPSPYVRKLRAQPVDHRASIGATPLRGWAASRAMIVRDRSAKRSATRRGRARPLAHHCAAINRVHRATPRAIARSCVRRRKRRWLGREFDFPVDSKSEIQWLDTIQAIHIDQIRVTMALIPLLGIRIRPPLRQSGPRPDARLLRQTALEVLTRSARSDSPRRTGRNKFPATIGGGRRRRTAGGGGGGERGEGRQRLTLGLGLRSVDV